MRFQRYRTSDGQISWRFLTANHRLVALSPQGFPDEEHAAAAIRVVQLNAASASMDFSSDRGGMWTWAMRLEQVVVAISAHPYGRRREADSAAGRFRLQAAEARLDPWVAGRGEQRPRRRPVVLDC
ncbi:hypothetical protein DPM19_30715 [Actinomadura craniellae]|uniref:DUF1508 domain-containing protein n=1 Tax=Actinomadura craniellae TaxID=2231787 RepID=A0A365GX42_9ACTN|nr:DUF1508 domain-containing protein [Actinomadura craniellae]RAY11399.1 hypothetical protein DPM19_30715 [Actinomadura craniellae]